MHILGTFIALLSMSLNNDGVPSIDNCSTVHKYHIIHNISDLPLPVRKEMQLVLPGIAESGKPSQISDNVGDVNLPRRRFIGAFKSDNYWHVVYHKGIINNISIIKFSAVSNDKSRYYVVPYSNLIGPVCEIVKSSVDGVSAGGLNKY